MVQAGSKSERKQYQCSLHVKHFEAQACLNAWSAQRGLQDDCLLHAYVQMAHAGSKSERKQAHMADLASQMQSSAVLT